MQNLHLFSIKNKIDFESNLNLFKSNLFYECSFLVNNKIILFNNKKCFLKFRELKNSSINWRKELYLTDDIHLNKRGHEILYRVISKAVF